MTHEQDVFVTFTWRGETLSLFLEPVFLSDRMSCWTSVYSSRGNELYEEFDKGIEGWRFFMEHVRVCVRRNYIVPPFYREHA